MFQTFKGLSTASRTLSVFLKRNISVGQSIPKAELTVFEYKNGAFDKQTVSTDKLFGKGKHILVGFPGKFSLYSSTYLFQVPSLQPVLLNISQSILTKLLTLKREELTRSMLSQ